MKLAVLSNTKLREELVAQGVQDDVQVEWVSDITALTSIENADGYIDLLFENAPARIKQLQQVKAPVIVNAVVSLPGALPSSFIRINGWNSFLQRPLLEASCEDETIKTAAAAIATAFKKKIEWVPDVPGFISARVVAMIINEAYFAWDEKVSTREEIDTAMRSGTNYPYGPFEWAEKIGLKNVLALLTLLAKKENRYQPAKKLLEASR